MSMFGPCVALQSIRADLGKERAVVEVRKRSKEERKEEETRLR